ncbi:MAG: hypothetical protein JXA30_23380 [Deltaproteobacteria bacterium]|nr:hypothetical protein [Deltaproteobacteria bacterium]
MTRWGKPEGPYDDAKVYYIHRAQTSSLELRNSKIALDSSVALFHAVEIDISFSQDLIPYVSHGDDLDDLTGHAIEDINKLTSKKIDALETRDGGRLLSFERFCHDYLPRFRALLLDVKTNHDELNKKASIFSTLIPRNMSHKITVLSLSGSFLTTLKHIRPDLSLACESFSPTANWLAGFTAVSQNIYVINTHRDIIARWLGLSRIYWTAHNEAEARRIRSFGPDGIIVHMGGTNPPTLPIKAKR